MPTKSALQQPQPVAPQVEEVRSHHVHSVKEFIEKVKGIKFTQKVLSQGKGTKSDWAGYATLMTAFK